MGNNDVFTLLLPIFYALLIRGVGFGEKKRAAK